MLIRCEKCSTTYELEERLIPPGGAPVQCSRCEHVFRAYPPSRTDGETYAATPAPAPGAASGPRATADPERRPGLELVPPPANDIAGEPPEPQREPSPVVRGSAPVATEAALDRGLEAHEPASRDPEATVMQPLGPAASRAPGASASRTPPPAPTYKPPPGPVIPPGKPVRKVPNPELDGTDVPSVAPLPRRGMTVDVGTRKRSKSSWVVWGAVALLALLVVAGTVSWWQEQREASAAAKAAKASVSRAVSRERQDALNLLMRDDPASAERAAAQLDAAVRREPASAARADHALALALLSQQARDQAARQESRARALDEERTRAGADGGARVAELTAEADTARAEVDPLRERAGRLLAEARAELEAVPADLSGDASVARARAWVLLSAGDRASAGKAARSAVGADPWMALASILADVPENAGGDALQAAADRLEQLATKHPEFVRPRFLAGRIRAELGDGDRAVRDLDGVLEANPQHVDARRLRAEIAPVMTDGAAPSAPDEARAGAPRTDTTRGAPPQRSPAVNGPSHRGNGAVPAQGR